MKVETQNAAVVLTQYVWKSIHENTTPKIKLNNDGKVEIDQDELLKYVMKFQQYLVEKENNKEEAT